MTKEEVKTFLPIMQAYVEGKQIQRLYHNGWKDVDKLTTDLYISPELYRIKPESKYRPFKNAEECWTEMQKHQPFGWTKDENVYFSIVAVNNIDVSMANASGDLITQSFGDLVEDITFADGTPFGLFEEE